VFSYQIKDDHRFSTLFFAWFIAPADCKACRQKIRCLKIFIPARKSNGDGVMPITVMIVALCVGRTIAAEASCNSQWIVFLLILLVLFASALKLIDHPYRFIVGKPLW
jgi:hypothetical protein